MTFTPPQATGPAHEIRIQIMAEGTALTAVLDDTAVAQDFSSLLPLELTLEDYASKEKISALPRRLLIAGAPPGAAGAVGDIAYYAPWGNLAIFYDAAPYATGLVTLGRITDELEPLLGRSNVRVRIHRVT